MEYTGNRPRPVRGVPPCSRPSGPACGRPAVPSGCREPAVPCTGEPAAPYGICFVAPQPFGPLYPPEQALAIGTIFVQLDYPFLVTCCKGGRL